MKAANSKKRKAGNPLVQASDAEPIDLEKWCQRQGSGLSASTSGEIVVLEETNPVGPRNQPGNSLLSTRNAGTGEEDWIDLTGPEASANPINQSKHSRTCPTDVGVPGRREKSTFIDLDPMPQTGSQGGRASFLWQL